MVTLFLLVALLVWLPLAFAILSKRPLVVLLIWLVLGPVISNVVKWPGANPFFWTGPESDKEGGYLTLPSTVTLEELLEPTRLVIVTLLALIILQAIVARKEPQPLDRTEKAMVFFSILLVFSSVIFSNRMLFGLRITIDVFLVPFLGYYLGRRFIRSEKQYWMLNRAMVYLGLLVIVTCAAERLVNTQLFYRLKGPFMQGAQRGSSILHIVVVVIFFAVLLDAITTRRDRSHLPAAKKEIRTLIILSMPLVILLTWSRGNWLGLVVALWAFILLGRRLMAPSQRMAIAGLTFIILPLIILGVLRMESSAVVSQRIGNVENVTGRLATWKVVADRAMENPVLGIGLNDTRDVLGRASSQSNVTVYSTVHNSYLTLFTELGLVGVLSYLAILISLGHSGWVLYRRGKGPRERWRGITVLAVLLGYQLPGLFANTVQMFGFGHLLVFVFLGGLVGATLRPENLLAPGLALVRTRTGRLMQTPPRVREVRFS
ncbi:MAG TPA: O-antigen ligase family protein [Acidobacteriota bacterium]|nr:O-antigen ligase family protein [Acidobacteriota bacterium]